MVNQPMNKSKIELATEWMEDLANDNSHGYSQTNRWGWQDYDCSSGVITAWQQAGVPVKTYGATYTGNMREAFLKAGFKDVTASVNLLTGSGLRRGDVLLNYANHTCMFIGNGKVVNIRSDDGHPEPGDQTGNEIRIQNYWNYHLGWDCVLRYFGEEDSDEPSEEIDIIHPTNRRTYFHLEYGDGIGNPKPQVKAWQNMLICWGYDIGKAGADGEFGSLTMIATRKWQEKAAGIGADVEINGIVDEDDWKEIIRIEV